MVRGAERGTKKKAAFGGVHFVHISLAGRPIEKSCGLLKKKRRLRRHMELPFSGDKKASPAAPPASSLLRKMKKCRLRRRTFVFICMYIHIIYVCVRAPPLLC